MILKVIIFAIFLPLVLASALTESLKIDVSSVSPLQIYSAGSIVEVEKESEKLGKFKVKRIDLEGSGSKLVVGSDKQLTAIVEFAADEINREGFKGEEVNWFEYAENFPPLPSKLVVDAAAILRGGGHNYAAVQLAAKKNIKFSYADKPEKRALNIVVLLRLNKDLEPDELMYALGGMDGHGESKRLLKILYWVDIDANGFQDLVIEDHRYAGKSALIIQFDEKSTNVREIAIDGWD